MTRSACALRPAHFTSAVEGTVRVYSAYFGPGFEGFVPDRGALQNKSALPQFAIMAELLRLDRAAFIEEVSLNSKAVFLNFLCWAQSDWGSLSSQEKVLSE